MSFIFFQSNLLASGASESEIFIWDLNRVQTPMTPGAKSQPVEDVRCIAWNRQVDPPFVDSTKTIPNIDESTEVQSWL
jgi:WD40 repeat protein